MLKYRPWNKEDDAKLVTMAKKNRDIEDIQEVLGRSKTSIMSRMVKLNVLSDNDIDATTIPTPKARRTNIEKAAINFLDIKLKDKDYTNVWSSILGFQDVLEERSIEQSVANIKINTKKWVGIAFQGDLHIGNMATDYKTMLEHRDMIAETDNLYVCFNGDYCDNYIPTSHAAGMFEALFPPAVQKNLAKAYVESIKDKVLALVAGCHDIFGLKASDWDLAEYLAKHGEAVYLGSGGVMNIVVGKQKYKIMMRHKYRYNSQDNATSTVKRMFEKCGGFDVGVVSHNHVAAMEESAKEGLDGNQKRIFVRAGTYKIHDRYARQEGFSRGATSVPIVLFNPTRRDIRGFQNIQEGIEYLKFLNG